MPKKTKLERAVTTINAIVAYNRLPEDQKTKSKAPILKSAEITAISVAAAENNTPEKYTNFYKACGFRKGTFPSAQLEFYRNLKIIIEEQIEKTPEEQLEEQNAYKTILANTRIIHNSFLLALAQEILTFNSDIVTLGKLLGFNEKKETIEKREKIYNYFLHPDRIRQIIADEITIVRDEKEEKFTNATLMQLVGEAAKSASKNIEIENSFSGTSTSKRKTNKRKTNPPSAVDNFLKMVRKSEVAFFNLFVKLPGSGINSFTLEEKILILKEAIQLQRVTILASLLAKEIFSSVFTYEQEQLDPPWKELYVAAYLTENIALIDAIMTNHPHSQFLLTRAIYSFKKELFENLYNKNYWNFSEVLVEVCSVNPAVKEQVVTVLLESAINNKKYSDYADIVRHITTLWPNDNFLPKVIIACQRNFPGFYEPLKPIQNLQPNPGFSSFKLQGDPKFFPSSQKFSSTTESTKRGGDFKNVPASKKLKPTNQENIVDLSALNKYPNLKAAIDKNDVVALMIVVDQPHIRSFLTGENGYEALYYAIQYQKITAANFLRPMVLKHSKTEKIFPEETSYQTDKIPFQR